MIKVALEARALRQPGGGVRSYVEHLYKGLQVNPDITVNVFKDTRFKKMIPFWLNWYIPWQVKKLQPDVAHFTKAALPSRLACPSIVTIYDIIPILFPQSQKILARMYWPRALRHAAQASDHIITISERSKADIIKYLGVTAHKVTVIPLGIDTSFFKPASEEDIALIKDRFRLPKKYILYVGTIEPRKNIPALIRSLAQIASDIPHKLVIAGRNYKGLESIKSEIRRLDLSDRVIFLNFVKSEYLPALYSGAELFMWPSIYEGWGFPPQEAMACGTPVIVSDGGSLPEVVGNAGIIQKFTVNALNDRLCDSVFENMFAREVQLLLSDTARRKDMSAQGLKHVTKFSWQEVIDRTIGVYKKIIV